jgi:predicted metalloprotease with PDZ domain
MWLLTTRTVQVVTISVGLGLAPLTASASMSPPLCGFEASAGNNNSGHSQGYLGVDIRDVNSAQISALKLKDARGAEVIRVDHDGPAGKAGLREQDVILQVNGIVIEGEEHLRHLLRDTPAGRSVTLLLSRAGQLLTVTTNLANRMDIERKAWEERWVVPVPSDDNPTPAAQPAASTAAPSNGSNTPGSTAPKGQSFFSTGTATRSGQAIMGALTPNTGYTGVMVETMGPQLAEFFGTTDGGVLVESVEANSPAAAAGLKAGDVVLRANSVKMANTSDWSKIVRENRGKTVELVILRDKKTQTLQLIPDSKKRSAVESPNWFEKSARYPRDLAVSAWHSWFQILG